MTARKRTPRSSAPLKTYRHPDGKTLWQYREGEQPKDYVEAEDSTSAPDRADA